MFREDSEHLGTTWTSESSNILNPASAVRMRFLNEHLDVSGCSCKFEPKAKQTYHMLVVHIMILKCPKFQCSLPVSHACISISDHVLQSTVRISEKQNFPPSRNELICGWCREVSATISTPQPLTCRTVPLSDSLDDNGSSPAGLPIHKALHATQLPVHFPP